MTDQVAIADALLIAAAQLETTGPMLPVALPDIAFDPPADGKYLRVALFFNSNMWEGLGNAELAQGLLQITVVWPQNQGVLEPGRVAEQVKAAFTKGLKFRSGSVTIKVNRAPWSSSPILDGGQTLVPVTISWSAS